MSAPFGNIQRLSDMQLTIPWKSLITAVLFCGGGGTSEGMERALGEPVGFALNHDVVGTKKEQMGRIGNCVPPQFMEAIVRSNLPKHCAVTP